MNDIERNLIGRSFEASNPVEVTAEMILGFCASVGIEPERNNEQPAEIVAPLSISGSFRAAEDIFDNLPPFERRLLASMELEFLAPIKAGDIITITSQVAEIYEQTGRSGPLTFTVIRSILKNQHGEIVTRLDHRFSSRK
jgi:hypothetical protein